MQPKPRLYKNSIGTKTIPKELEKALASNGPTSDSESKAREKVFEKYKVPFKLNGQLHPITGEPLKEWAITEEWKDSFNRANNKQMPSVTSKKQSDRNPIVVSDLNDPKFKAYNDSLSLYNLYLKEKKVTGADSPSSKLYKSVPFYQGKPEEIPFNKDNKDKVYYNSKNKISPSREEYYTDTKDDTDIRVYRYEKPIQPVEYRKKTISVKPAEPKNYYSEWYKDKFNDGTFGYSMHKSKNSIPADISECPECVKKLEDRGWFYKPKEEVKNNIKQYSKPQSFGGRDFIERTGLIPGDYPLEQVNDSLRANGLDTIRSNSDLKYLPMPKKPIVHTHYTKGGKIPQYGLGSIIGGLLGTGAGALLALPTGGMSVAAGAGLGSMIGGGVGALGDTVFETPNGTGTKPVQQLPTPQVLTDPNLGKNRQIYPDGGKLAIPSVTKLNQGQEIAYNNWLKSNNILESKDYDMRGYWKEAGFLEPKHTGHFDDTYKLLDYTPFGQTEGDNYSRLSEGSKYSGNGSYLTSYGDKTAPNNSFDKRNQGFWNEKDQFIEYPLGGSVSSQYWDGRRMIAQGGHLSTNYAQPNYEGFPVREYPGYPIEKYNMGGNCYPKGGILQASEIEGQEVAKMPNGNSVLADAPSHSHGGLKLNLPEGTEITSDRIINLGTGNTFAKDQRRVELNKNRQMKRLDKLRPHDTYLKNGIDRDESKSRDIFKLQELTKAATLENVNNIMAMGGTIEYSKGGTIHIKPENKGKFTAYLKRTGKTVSEAKNSSDPHIRKMATFALNAKHWKHANGGYVKYYDGDIVGDPEDPTKPLVASDKYPEFGGNPFPLVEKSTHLNIPLLEMGEPGGLTGARHLPDLGSGVKNPRLNYTSPFSYDTPWSSAAPLGQNGGNAYVPPEERTFENTGDPRDVNNEKKPPFPWKTAAGMGLGAIGMGAQFLDSFNPDPLTRIQNPYRDASLQSFRNSINSQRNLKFDVNDQIADIKGSEAAANNFANTNLSSGSSRMAAKLANRGQSLTLGNQVYGARNRANTEIQERANQMEQQYGQFAGQLGSEDAAYENQYRDNILRQKAKLRGNRYSALSNASTILQQSGVQDELFRLLPKLYPSADPSIFKRG